MELFVCANAKPQFTHNLDQQGATELGFCNGYVEHGTRAVGIADGAPARRAVVPLDANDHSDSPEGETAQPNGAARLAFAVSTSCLPRP